MDTSNRNADLRLEQICAILTANGASPVHHLQSYMLHLHGVEVPRPTMNRWLTRLRREQRVVRLGYGIYGLPHQAKGPPNLSRWVAERFAAAPHSALSVADVGRLFHAHFGFRCRLEILESIVTRLELDNYTVPFRGGRWQWSGKRTLPPVVQPSVMQPSVMQPPVMRPSVDPFS
jgi:hypothetical protein